MNTIDADGHITESTEQLAPFVDPAYRNYGPSGGLRSYFPSDGWDRSARGRLGRSLTNAEQWLRAMDEGGVDTAVLYPTNGLGIAWVREPDFAAVLCKAYNNFFYEQYASKSPRLRGVALLSLQNVPEAVNELRRVTRDLGMVGGMLPAVGLRKPLGHEDYWPLYEEAEKLGCMLASHATVRGPHYFGAEIFDRFIEVHTLSHPFAQMMQFASVIFRGVPERFPRLRIGFLEAGCSWLLYWLDRMDEEWEKRGELEAPLCQKKPSRYLESGQICLSAEASEKSLPEVVRRFGEEFLFFASDLPHWDSNYPENLHELRARQDLSEGTRRKMLQENACRLYGL
jgi:uncharacterized protein